MSADGRLLYVAALGSDRVGVFETALLDSDERWARAGDEPDLTVTSVRQLQVQGGPAGLVLGTGRN